MNQMAEPLVDKKVSFISHIPDAIRDILAEEDHDETVEGSGEEE